MEVSYTSKAKFKQCKQCGAYYNGKHYCDGLMKFLWQRAKSKFKK